MLKAGMKAPEFSLQNQYGELINLKDYLGKKVVIYFYPKDHTPGCTKQACAFRDNYEEFKKNNIVVFGISKDTVSSHMKFVEDYNLPFTLLADPNLEVIQAYDVWKEKKMFGKAYMGIMRSTYVIDENGVIIKVFAKANPDTNAKEILDFLNS